MHYDLHIHSCLSPCADDDMTPNNIVNMALINGLDVIALTDHNATGNCRATAHAGEKNGLIVIPGMELTTSEEIHTVCLFPDCDSAEAFGEYVRANRFLIENKEEIYGNQILADENDAEYGREKHLLVTASYIGIYDVPPLVGKYNGVCILAHIDRHSNGILGILGDIDRDMGFRLAEVSKSASAEQYKERFGFLDFVSDSDAHNLWKIAEADEDNGIEAEITSAGEFLSLLQKNIKKNR